MKFAELYKRDLAANNYEPDAAQLIAVAEFERLSEQLGRMPEPGWFAKLRGSGNTDEIQGLYLWGGVGRGKTYLMDLFFNALPFERKFRVHFHRFMRMVHKELKTLSDTSDPLDVVSERLARQYRLICFDEFFVSDIADAMILGRLLKGLFHRQVKLVATSNLPPADLYRDGLQRQQFLPAITMLEQYCEVLNVDGGIDYRLRLLDAADLYLTPPGKEADARLNEYFSQIAPGLVTEKRTLDIEGRRIDTVRCAKGVAWFTFVELCDGPRSPNDYIELARLFQTVVVEGVPVLSPDSEDQARRFIALVDEFYDRRVKLILSAATGLDDLYQGSRLSFEFERTKSRLVEMQSHDYLAQAHRA